MPVTTSSPLQSLRRRENSHLLGDVYLRPRAFYYALPALQRQGDAVTGQEGELAALRGDVSSLVCIRDLVLMQLCACG